jgi:hypothetical protein
LAQKLLEKQHGYDEQGKNYGEQEKNPSVYAD